MIGPTSPPHLRFARHDSCSKALLEGFHYRRPRAMRKRRYIYVSVLTVLAPVAVGSGGGDAAEYGETEESGQVQSALPVRPLTTSDPPYLEAVFTTPLQFAMKDGFQIPSGSGADQIRNQLGGLIAYAQDVGSATDVHISA